MNCLSNKISYVSSFCIQNNTDVLGICESWLQPSLPDSVVKISGYDIFRNDFPSRKAKHGVCAYVKVELCARRLQEVDQILNTLALHLPKHDLFVIVVYRPPSNSPAENEALLNFLSVFSIGKEIVIMGDLNLPSIKWNNNVPSLGVTGVDLQFLNLFDTLGLCQWVVEPTFISSGNILDLVLTSEGDRIQSIETCAPFPHCGHVVVKFDYLFQSSVVLERSNIVFRDWSRGNFVQLQHILSEFDWDYEFLHLDINCAYDRLCQIINQLVDKFVPCRKPKKSGLPWLRRMSSELIKQKTTAWKKYKNQRNLFGRTACQALQALFEFRQLNENLKNHTYLLQVEYEENLISQRSTKPKLFHSYIRNKKTSRPKVGPILMNGVLSDSPCEMSEVFVDAFASVFVANVTGVPYPHQVCHAQLTDVGFTEEDVKILFRSLKPDSSVGPDDISPHLLKECAGELAYPFFKLFQLSLSSCTLPDIWKTSNVSPIFKKGSHSNPLNYRPISLTSVPCKTMERLIAKEMFRFLESHLIFDNSQYGFRPKRSAADQLILTYNYITLWYDKGFIVDLLLFDFKKAFDLVPHDILLEKLRLIGISGELLAWIESFLCGRQMKVCIGGEGSSARPVLSGVPQGSVLGPLLFIIFINHIGSQLSCKYMNFADDLKLFLHFPKSICGGAPGFAEIQNDINILSRTASSWGLKFAPDKCVHLRFSRPSHVITETSYYHLENEPIKNVSSHRDLGVTVDTSLKFHAHIRESVNKAGGVASGLLRATVCRSPEFMTAILISDIRPVLDFCSSLWNLGYLGDLKLIESVQRRWTKQIRGLENFSYRERLKELNLYSVKGRLLRCDLILCFKIFNNLSVIQPNDLFTMAPPVGTRGHRYKIQVPQTSIDARRLFFSCRVIKPWNELSSLVVESTSVESFKRALHDFLGERLFEFV